MPFNKALAERIQQQLARKKGVEEKMLFGCKCFLLNGNVVVGVWKDSLIVRLGEDQGEEALLEPHVKPFDITGKPMKNWVLVKPGQAIRHHRQADEELGAGQARRYRGR